MESKKTVKLALAVLPFAAVALVASADIHTWTGGALNGNWTSGNNWAAGSVPGAPATGDSVIIDDTSPQNTVQYDNVDQSHKMVDILLGDGMTLNLIDPNQLNLSDLLTIEGDAIISGGGTLDGVEQGGRIVIDGGTAGASLTKQGTADVFIGRRSPS